MELVTYCGLYCDLCAERTRIPERAAALRAAMTEEGWPFWGHTVSRFTEFWTLLEELARSYPNLVGDNRRLQTVGLQQWIDEQIERVRRGVVYADIRYQTPDAENDAGE